MFNRLTILGVVVSALSLSAAPASAKHHAGEKPEVGHKQGGKAKAPAKKEAGDDKGKHAEPGDDRGGAAGGHGKDDKPGHK